MGDGFDTERLDDAFNGRVRLGIMAYLMDVHVADFTELKAVLEATQGNLSAHLRRLEEAGYIEIVKRFQDRKSLTRAHITPAGRKAFASYLDALAKLVEKRP